MQSFHSPSRSRRELRDGIYCPTVTFFDQETEELDLERIRKHAVRLARAGLVGLVTLGSNGEAAHLTLDERFTITSNTRSALDAAGFPDIPIIVGASRDSVKGTLELCKMAAMAKADYVLLLAPSYYGYAMSEDRLRQFFSAVADQSPLPIILYNYPGVVAGIDMDSDFLIRLGQHPNIVGTKFTCGNTGKLTRVARALDARTVGHLGSGYMALGGMADFTTQTLISGGSGMVAGGAKVTPKAIVRVWDLWAQGKIQDAIELQRIISTGDWITTKTGVPGTKSAIQSYFGYGGFARQPLNKLSDAEGEDIKSALDELMKLETSLPDKFPAF
jgi:L-threo-3-deoxy-hexylosonate aldolase